MNIVEYLSSLPAEKYHYLPNKGNAGDSLISYAAYQLFNESNLNYEKVKLEGKWSYKVAEKSRR
ncbi:MAG: hypothetical protein HC899_30210 [Leptolyngbyaceae cyanobacterium SM1_4_3]|nr:hypothetical protein [Leptolyngbyaceae cyanobacterium SM1_4_3]